MILFECPYKRIWECSSKLVVFNKYQDYKTMRQTKLLNETKILQMSAVLFGSIPKFFIENKVTILVLESN